MVVENKTVVESAVSTPYDDAFRTMVNDCAGLLIPVINEVFGKHYSGDETIVFHPNEHFVNQQGGNEDKRITDSSFSIIGETEDRYLFECQSRSDASMLIRIFEYVTQIALDEGEIVENVLEVSIPNAAILFLRSNSKTPDEMKILMRTPGGDVQFGVPVMKMKNYSKESIFAKKLYFLLPFYIFIHEAEFEVYESDNAKLEELKKEYVEIFERLEQAAADGALSYYYMRSIVDMSKLVLENIAKKYDKVRKGVDSVMGGTILEHESKTIYNAGRMEGLEKGIEKGLRKGKVEEKQLIARRLFQRGAKAEEIADVVDASVALVKEWIDVSANATR